MATDSRNAKLVAALIGSMTLGAVVLLWMEPSVRSWSSSGLLMAETGRPIESVQVEYAEPGTEFDESAIDCLIRVNGECVWQPRGGKVRLVVEGSVRPELPREQMEKVLAVFGSMSRRPGFNMHGVWIHPASDARLHPELPAQAHRLCELLLRKGIVQ